MTPATLISEARSDGVLVELTLKGTLKVTGPEGSIQQWIPTLGHHRLALLDTLWSELAQFRLDLVAADVAKGPRPQNSTEQTIWRCSS